MNYKYRKLPVVIEAFQMTKARRYDNSEWPEWLHRAWNFDRDAHGALFCNEVKPDDLFIRTLEGEQFVTPDDFIIQGVQGEIYPCKPDIFAETYEEVV